MFAQLDERRMTCQITMVCDGVDLSVAECERADGTAEVHITDEEIRVTAFGETLVFDDIPPSTPGFDFGLSVSGLQRDPAPARYMNLMLSNDTLGVLISEERGTSGQFFGSSSFMATCPG